MGFSIRRWILVGMLVFGVIGLGQMAIFNVPIENDVIRDEQTPTPIAIIESTTLPDTLTLYLTPTCEPFDIYSTKGPSGREPTPCYYEDMSHYKNIFPVGAKPCKRNKKKPSGRQHEIKSMIENYAKQDPTKPCTECSKLLETICEWDEKGTEWESGLLLLLSPPVRNVIKDTFECIPDNDKNIAIHSPGSTDRLFFDDLEHQVLLGNETLISQLGPTEYYRKKPHGIMMLKNIAVGCDTERQPWMDHRRDCFLTVNSIHTTNSGLAATHRKGRHAIYRQRQSAYQYGTTIKNINQKVTHVTGTSIFLSSFSQANIGHAIHDALFSFLAVLSSYEELQKVFSLPKPRRVVLEPDFFRNSIRFYSVFCMIFSKYVTGTSPHVILFNNDVISKQRIVTQQQRPVDAKLFSFESAIFTGEDRELKGSGVSSGARYPVVNHFRKAVFDELGPKQSSDNRVIKIYIYGRTDVYRRSILNLGDLVDGIVKKIGRDHVILIPVMSLHPLNQAELFRGIDILLTVQGAHLQNSIFMPSDASIIEFSPCRARQTSFLKKYHTFLSTQSHIQVEICFPSINLGKDKYGQNLTLCDHHVNIAEVKVTQEIERIKKQRGLL